MHEVHVQMGNHTHFRHNIMIMDDNDAKAISFLLSEIIKIVAKSPDVLCIFGGILWTKGRSLVQGGKCMGLEGEMMQSMLRVFPTPGSAPELSR